MPTIASPAASTQAEPAQTAPTGLVIDGLTKELGGRTVVDGLRLEIAPGELVSLLGPSGCGKTTTLRMIAGFLEPDAGAIRLGGADMVGLGPERRPSAMVFQQYALWPHMTVFKNVAFPLEVRRMPRGEIRERVMAALDAVNLTHHAQSRPPHISGGEQQRAALARALVQQPRLLLLDEPLSNLDAKLRVRVRDELRDLQQRLGITTVLVTHDQEEALAVSDRIAVMNGGRIEQFSTPDELYRSPRTLFVASFVGTMNVLDGPRLDGAAGDSAHRAAGAADTVWAVRPEDVLVRRRPSRDGERARVERVLSHGHFHELVIAAGRHRLRAMVSGEVPVPGEEVEVELRNVRCYRDGVLEGADGAAAGTAGATAAGKEYTA